MPVAWWDWPDRCRILRHLDGDTLEAVFVADAGFRVTTEVRQIVRLWGIDTDELRASSVALRTSAKRAKTALEAMLPVGTVCTARTLEDADARGRWLGVFVLPNGAVVNDEMVRLGFARPYDGGARG